MRQLLMQLLLAQHHDHHLLSIATTCATRNSRLLNDLPARKFGNRYTGCSQLLTLRLAGAPPRAVKHAAAACTFCTSLRSD